LESGVKKLETGAKKESGVESGVGKWDYTGKWCWTGSDWKDNFFKSVLCLKKGHVLYSNWMTCMEPGSSLLSRKNS
jgi:hypothetical protein